VLAGVMILVTCGFVVGYAVAAVREWDHGYQAGCDTRHLEIRERG
jgi:hypothetical protein